ncbi:MAG: DUF6141 family protein [Candidatus Freyarchaeota archaeon]
MSWDPIFREVQRFRQPWLWALLFFDSALIAAIFLSGVYTQLVLGQPWGDNPMSNETLLVMGGVLIFMSVALPLLFYYAKLVVEVRSDGVHICFFPFVRRMIPFEEVKAFTPRVYNPLLEYGGWGIRWSPKRGWAYNVSGNRGVLLELVNGKRLMIGSQHPETLAEAIRVGMRMHRRID